METYFLEKKLPLIWSIQIETGYVWIYNLLSVFEKKTNFDLCAWLR